ncbi:hypothetical protein [Edaphobacter aggregans]|uniref:hypothetical protein n=1 Tax=Edaphobacter aggregans TaxID=570835 RepID=UPI000F744C4A|nr:hypothetical protein [Edaphobacter aggregans]
MEKTPATTAATVRFIGCQSDGQVGPLEAPKGDSKVVQIATQATQQLAYYKAEQGFGVLAPRGWHCFGTYGSSGSSLYVSPQPLNATIVFSDNWKGFTGPVIQISTEIGDTSGRFGVARTIARVFPSHKAFVRDVIANGFAQANDFPFGPYPNDQLIYKSKEIVEYQTPAQTDGLGTQSRLQKNADPIRGVAILVGSNPDLVFLAARLPPDKTDLASIIIRQAELDSAQSKN